MHFHTTPEEPSAKLLPNKSGSANPIPGDSNGDGRFDAHDLTLVLQADEYQDNVADNSTFGEGDWNGDGDFTREDIVFALQARHYIA